MAAGVTIQMNVGGVAGAQQGIQKMIQAAQAAGKVPGGANPLGNVGRGGGQASVLRAQAQAAQAQAQQLRAQAQQQRAQAALLRAQARAASVHLQAQAQQQSQLARQQAQAQRQAAQQQAQQQRQAAQQQRQQARAAAQAARAAAQQARRNSPGYQLNRLLSNAIKLSRAAFFIKEAVDMITTPFEEAAKASRALRSATLSAGGGSGLSAVDTALGRESGSFAGEANSFRDRLLKDPFAAMSFGAIVPPAVFGGNQDNTVYLRRAIEKLANIQDENNRLLEARRMGLEAVLPFTYASRGARGFAYSEGKNAEEMNRAGRGFEGDINAAGGAASSKWQQVYEQLLNNTTSTRLGFQTASWAVGSLAKGALQMMNGDWKGGLKEWGRHPDLANGSSQQQAMDANTRALNTLSGAIKSGGMTIGGHRTQNAIPPALRSLELERNFEADKVRLGGAIVR